MKKWLIPLVIVLLLIIWGMRANNNVVNLEETVTEAWANVESSYQRRNDLIGNLVKTVQGAADFEKTTLTQVIEARAKATSTTIDASNLTADNMAQFQQAQSGLTGAISKLLVSVERYPELKANKGFLELQSQLEGTENRINISRNRFNKNVKVYNSNIRQFPRNLILGVLGFDKKAYYQADAGSENAPDVEFDFN